MKKAFTVLVIGIISGSLFAAPMIPFAYWKTGASSSGTPGPTPDIAWLKTQDASGTIAVDSIGAHLHNGTLSGVTIPTWTTGQDGVAGHALSFNGTTAWVTLNNSPLIGNSTTGSINIWINISGAIGATECFYGEGSSSSTTPIILLGVTTGGNVVIQVRDDSNQSATVTSGGTVNNGSWHMVTVVIANKSSLQLYVDKVLQGTDTTTRSTQTMNEASVGSLNRIVNALFYGGSIASLRVYTTALTQTDINNLFSSGTP